jgi:hypothetical protein
LRSLMRHRTSLVQMASTHIQHTFRIQLRAEERKRTR